MISENHRVTERFGLEGTVLLGERGAFTGPCSLPFPVLDGAGAVGTPLQAARAGF